jgi:hypothetical protein
MIADQKGGRIPSSGSVKKPVKELEKDLVKLRNDLIRYKDAVHGTTVWKEMTQHTVPHSLRPVDGFQKGDDLQLYKALTETRAIVFNHHKASSAPVEVRHCMKNPPSRLSSVFFLCVCVCSVPPDSLLLFSAHMLVLPPCARSSARDHFLREGIAHSDPERCELNRRRQRPRH